MESKAELIDISRDWKNGKTRLLFEVDGSPEDAERYSGKKLRLKAVEWKEKRSLDANAYYWVLISKIAGLHGVSNSYMHNFMLRAYGQPDLYDEKKAYIVLPDTEETEKKAMEAETYHIKPTSEVKIGKDGKAYRTYFLLRGSSTYNTAEMSRLINGLVSECKEAGIETLTHDDLERMMLAYEEKYKEKHRAV